MDISLALNDIEIRQGIKGYKRKSLTFSHKADVVGYAMYINNFCWYGYFASVYDINN